MNNSNEVEIEVEDTTLPVPEDENLQGMSSEAIHAAMQARIAQYAEIFNAIEEQVKHLQEGIDSGIIPEADRPVIQKRIDMFKDNAKLYSYLKDGSYGFIKLLLEETKFDESDFNYTGRMAPLYSEMIRKFGNSRKYRVVHPNYFVASMAYAFPDDLEFQRKVVHRVFDGLLKSRNKLLISNILSFPYYLQRAIAQESIKDTLSEEELKLHSYDKMITSFISAINETFGQWKTK